MFTSMIMMSPTIILALFLIGMMSNLFYWVFIFTKIKQYTNVENGQAAMNNPIPKSSLHHVPVSIIISARNEAQNLKELLPLLIQQAYSIYEIILVDDCSTDNTPEIMRAFDELSKITYIQITKDLPGKKHALTKAIQAAQYEVLLLTDADCRPTTDNWINSMVHCLKEGSMVLGYGPMVERKGWLNKYIRYETFLTAIQYFSYASWGHPYMGVGRNMMYTKSLFIQNNAFDKHKHIASGDDDLFVNSLSNPEMVNICLDEKSYMYSEAKSTFAEYYRQKTRHYSTSTSYKWIDQVSLGLFALSHIIVYILGILLFTKYSFIVIVAFLLRWGIIMIANHSIFTLLKIKNLWVYFPILDIISFLFYLLFIPAALFPRKKGW